MIPLMIGKLVRVHNHSWHGFNFNLYHDGVRGCQHAFVNNGATGILVEPHFEGTGENPWLVYIPGIGIGAFTLHKEVILL